VVSSAQASPDANARASPDANAHAASYDNAKAALQQLDKALDAKPHVEGHTLSVAAHELSSLRDKIAARQSSAGATPQSRRQLEHVNAIISIVLAGHFPLGGIPWGEIAKGREWLADLVADLEQHQPGGDSPADEAAGQNNKTECADASIQPASASGAQPDQRPPNPTGAQPQRQPNQGQ
jgi:hypothetical protein